MILLGFNVIGATMNFAAYLWVGHNPLNLIVGCLCSFVCLLLWAMEA